jgi:hypothetical protein
MAFGLKNAGATDQRLMDSALKDQIGKNLEVHVHDLMINHENKMLVDIAETFAIVRKYNNKLNQVNALLARRNGNFLGLLSPKTASNKIRKWLRPY